MGSTDKAAMTPLQLPPVFTFPTRPSYFVSIRSGSPPFLVGSSFLWHEVVINAFQEPLEFFVLCSAASLVDVRIVKFTHKSQCPWLWDCLERRMSHPLPPPDQAVCSTYVLCVQLCHPYWSTLLSSGNSRGYVSTEGQEWSWPVDVGHRQFITQLSFLFLVLSVWQFYRLIYFFCYNLSMHQLVSVSNGLLTDTYWLKD